jgi:CheY-like chemotaxis protein
VVEDQPDNRQIIRDMLAPTDCEITEADNGEEETEYFGFRPPGRAAAGDIQGGHKDDEFHDCRIVDH